MTDISRRRFLHMGLAATVMAGTGHAAEILPSQPPQPVDPRLKDVFLEADPLEATARNIKRSIRICVVDEDKWIKLLTHGQGWNDKNFKEISDKINNAARQRLLHYFPEAEHDPKLQESLARDLMSDGSTVHWLDSKGNRYDVILLGQEPKKAEDYFYDMFLDHVLAQKAASNAADNHLDLSPLYAQHTRYHELAHALDSHSVPTGIFSKLSVEDRFYERHKEEIFATSFAGLKLLQKTGDLKLARADCDLTQLVAFYECISHVRDDVTDQKRAVEISYFSPTLYEHLRKAFEESPDHLKTMSDSDLFALARHVANASVCSKQEFGQISEAFIAARTKLLPVPLEVLRHDAEDKTTTFDVMDLDKVAASGKPLVTEAVKRGLLNRNKPYVMELLKAEQRTLGLEKQLSP